MKITLKNWKKWTSIVFLSSLAYLGTGHQLAIFTWDLAHSTDGAEWLSSSSWNNTKRNPLGRLVAETLFPASSRWGSLQVKSDGELHSILHPLPVLEMTKKEYVRKMTFFWGLKVIYNIFLHAFAVILNMITWIVILAYSFLNALLAPLGIHF